MNRYNRSLQLPPLDNNPLKAMVPDYELTEAEFRDWVVGIEAKMCLRDDAVDRHTEDSPITLEHTFTTGLYTREINMPAGFLVMSRIHLYDHPFVISKGKVSVYDGTEVVTYTAPYMGVTKPGTKRILYVHEDTTWTTFHTTDKTCLEDVDVDGVITCGDYEKLDLMINKEITI